MPFWKSKKTKNRKTGGGGFLTYDDAYQLIQDNIDEAVGTIKARFIESQNK